MNLDRRAFIRGSVLFVAAAPAIVRAGSLMRLPPRRSGLTIADLVWQCNLVLDRPERPVVVYEWFNGGVIWLPAGARVVGVTKYVVS